MSLGKEESRAVSKVLNQEYLGMGSTVKDFEEDIINYLGTKMRLSVSIQQLQLSS